MRWSQVPFESVFIAPPKNGLTRPAKVRGSGIPMINMGELFEHDRIGNIEMELVPVNDRELSSMLVEKGDLLFARQSLVLSGAGKCSFVQAAEVPIEHVAVGRVDDDRTAGAEAGQAVVLAQGVAVHQHRRAALPGPNHQAL